MADPRRTSKLVVFPRCVSYVRPQASDDASGSTETGPPWAPALLRIDRMATAPPPPDGTEGGGKPSD